MEDGDVSGRDVGDHRRDEQRRDPLAGRILDHLGDLPVLCGEPTDSGTEVDSEPERIDVLVFAFGGESRLSHRLIGGGHAVLCEQILLSYERLVHSVFLGLEILDDTGDSDREVVRREGLDVIYAAHSVAKVAPEGVDIISYRGDDSHSCYNYSFIHVFILYSH